MLTAIIINLFIVIIIIIIWKDVLTLPRIREMKIRTKMLFLCQADWQNENLMTRICDWQEEEADAQADNCESGNGSHFLGGSSGKIRQDAWKVHTPWHKLYLRNLS